MTKAGWSGHNLCTFLVTENWIITNILSLPQNSVTSDTISRAQTPGIPPDEDSLMSMPLSFNQSTDDKSELLKILEEVSCSSSSEDSEEDEISEWLLL